MTLVLIVCRDMVDMAVVDMAAFHRPAQATEELLPLVLLALHTEVDLLLQQYVAPILLAGGWLTTS